MRPVGRQLEQHLQLGRLALPPRTTAAHLGSGAVNLTAAEGNTVDHFLGFARVDPADGSIYIGYHRSRLNPTAAVDRQRTHYFVMRSTDGGATFEPAVQASTIEGDERSSGYAYGWERGDYQGIDVLDGVAWPLWVDRQGVTGSAGEEEIVTRKLCSEPSHWSERAPTFSHPGGDGHRRRRR